MNKKEQGALNRCATQRLENVREQIAHSQEKIRTGRPLDAETDENRKIRRVAAVAQISQADAKDLLEKKRPAEAMATPGKAKLAESIQGGSIDFDPIVFLELGRTAANAVARVRGPETGSGFLISPDLFITNNHVIKDEAAAKATIVEFNYEEDRNLKARAVTRFNLDPDKFFYTSDIEELDFTIVGVGNKLDGSLEIQDCGYIKLSDAGNKHSLGEHANVIEHPNGDPKQVVLRENRILARSDDENALLYESDTLGGSSGSPVFNNEWEVIALHHWGGPHMALQNGGDVPETVNEGIRISAIVKRLKEVRGTLPPAMQKHLDAALTIPSFFESSHEEKSPKDGSPADKLIAELRKEKEISNSMPINREVTFTVPIEIVVRVPGLQAPTAAVEIPSAQARPQESGAERVKPDENYENRNGYNPRFLRGFQIPLPTLADEKLGEAAVLLEPEDGANPHELRYQNFSIVMNAERKMAYFTACNIDGAHLVPLNRDGTRGSNESFSETDQPEASETWYADPRISLSDQHGQEIYSKQKPSHLFDRGHQVRRLDPVWGRSAVRANADTFHFNNCCPQAAPFNQGQKFWQGIENFVLNNADEEDVRVSVFTGPIFKNQAKFRYRGLLVPYAFFKIVARVERRQLKVTAFLADQSGFLESMPESLGGRPESFNDPSKVKEFLSSVREIEALTHVDFGELRDFDTAPEGEEAARLLTSKDQVLAALGGAAYAS